MPIVQLTPLRNNLVTYARFVEQMISKSRDALIDRRRDLLEDIIGRDEARANESEMDLEAEGTSLIAQHQPMARDLRTVLMILHITTDLERMADHAVNIAETVREHLEGAATPPDSEVIRMFAVTLGMVGKAITAFLDEDALLGQRVCETDSEVDTLAARILERLSGTMTLEPATVAHNLAFLKVAANLERIADLSTNIGEDVIYMVQGRVIKHNREQEEGRQ
jgi:phosphate transport system protein